MITIHIDYNNSEITILETDQKDMIFKFSDFPHKTESFLYELMNTINKSGTQIIVVSEDNIHQLGEWK